MRRAIATIGLTVTALTFVLKFDQEKATMFTAAAAFATTTTEPQLRMLETSATTLPPTEGPASSAGPSEGTAARTPSSSSTTTTTTTAAAEFQVVDGPVVDTRFGPVQVEVTLTGSTLTDVEALLLPDHARRSRQINNYVEPIYRQAALQSQSADFWGVSGATVTWRGYVQSLQAALDQAGV